MDKRYVPLKEYGRVNKKPKLEIVVNKGRSNQSFFAPGPSRDAGTVRSPPKSSPDDFWDDDDDDVILLASQVVEKEIPHEQIPSATQSMEFSFSEFVPNSKVTSTQKPFVPDVEVFSELLDDDWGMDNIPEDPAPVFKVPAIVAAKRPHQETDKTWSESNHTERPFSDLTRSGPLALSQALPNVFVQQPQTSSLSLSQPTSNSKPSNREKAHECQILFLQKRADNLKKENTKLTKELDEFKNRMESKDGEVSLLRDEIRHMKQQIQSAHREKLNCSDAFKNEWKCKINELSKQIEAQQTVLEFKTMEISKLKINNADETMRYEHTMRENLNESISHQQNIRVTSPNRRRITKLHSYSWPNMRIPTVHSIPIEIFEHSTEKGNSKFRKDVFQREMERLQFQMSRLQYVTLMNTVQRTDLARSVIDSAKCVISEFWTYVHSLEYNKHCHSLPYHSYDITKDSRSEDREGRCSLFQAEVLFPTEKTINLRRYVAGLSIVCQMVPETSALLISIHHNEYLLIEIIFDALNKLGFSNEICQHFGVVESFALLLSTLWDNHIDEDCHHEHLISFLKTIVFCRPNAWASKHITRCLLKGSSAIRGYLCCNSQKQTFSVSGASYKFTPDSCVLQVYAAVLEIVFPVHQAVSASQFRLLAEICYNHSIFFTKCFTDPPPFVFDSLPYDSDLDADDFLNDIRCKCYFMMCNSVVKLLFQVLRQWQLKEPHQELKLIENLSKVGVHLMHTIYIRYYMTKLFNHKGYSTRHYLYFICKYWSANMDLLRFTEKHREALDELMNSHLVGINTSQELQDDSKVQRDLIRWYKCSGETRPEVTGNGIVADNGKDFAKLRILEKTCDAELFFKRY